jgi:hypothetical protein
MGEAILRPQGQPCLPRALHCCSRKRNTSSAQAGFPRTRNYVVLLQLAERRKPPPGTFSRSPSSPRKNSGWRKIVVESIRSSDGGVSRPFATDWLDAGRAVPLPGGDHLQVKVSRGRHLSAPFLWLSASSRPSPSAWSDPRSPHYTEVSFALLW